MKKFILIFSAMLATVLGMLGLTLVYAPETLPLIGYKLSLVIWAGVAGWWLDYVCFPYAQPKDYLCLKKEKWLSKEIKGLLLSQEDALKVKALTSEIVEESTKLGEKEVSIKFIFDYMPKNKQKLFIFACLRRSALMLAAIIGVCLGL